MKTLLICIISFITALGCSQKKPDELVTAIPVDNVISTGPTSKVYVDLRSFYSGDRQQFSWVVNGVPIKIDSAISSFDVPVHEGFDTVVFINSVNKRPDEVIICDLQPNEEYLIFYNACCGDFDFWIKDRNKRGKHELVTFSQIGNSPKKLLGGVLFEAAFLHPKRDVSLDGGYMRSAMFPNRFKIYVQEYLPESPDSTIASIIDPVSGKALMAFKDVDSKILSFNYIFIKDDTLKITVDTKTMTAKVVKTNKAK